jgi:hypothetical protein
MANKLLDFSEFENENSKFTAELQERGGNITFSNSGKGGDKKYFNLSLETFLNCLKDIKTNISSFKGHENYVEKEWRDLGSKYFTDKPANAQITVQTKPMFTTLSKIIMWANSQSIDNIDPEQFINLDLEKINKAISSLDELTDKFNPLQNTENDTEESIKKVEVSSNSIRDFALMVFQFFYKDNWDSLLNESTIKDATINEKNYKIYDHEQFKNLIGVFDSPQDKSTLSSSNTIRYFEEPIYIKEEKYYYFTTQWNATGEYNLSYKNLKNFIENKFPNYSITQKGRTFVLVLNNQNKAKILQKPFNLSTFETDCQLAGLKYSNKLITRFISSLTTKPFVILTGLSGSGKTKLAQAFVQWICQDEEQYRIIPVGADWTNREPLLGYPNALKPEEYVKPDSGVLDLIMLANKNTELPYFLILDEMNLSHVERYFADFLSAMESKESIPLYSEGQVTNGVPSALTIPKNLFIIGTVNIDETTNMFSPKVLDRANTIEFRVTEKEMEGFLSNIKEINMESLNAKGAGMAKSFMELSKNKSFPDTDNKETNEMLIRFFVELKKTGAEFGYRSATEILRLINQLNVLDDSLTLNEKLDIAIMQKLLPKLHGSRRKLCPILETLGSFCIDGDVKMVKDVFEKKDFDFESANVLFPLSLEKITRMYRGAIDNGFASFAEA